MSDIMDLSVPRRDLRPLLAPEAVAVIGASRDVAKMGGRCIAYPLRHGYPGRLYPVNPGASDVQGLPAFASVLDIPGPVDLAVVVVAAGRVLPALEQCAQKGVKAAVILASGFAETGRQGRQLQEALTDFARRTGMLLCGPNSNGLLAVHGRVVATSNPTLEAPLLPGRIAVVSQSGGLGLGSILYLGQKRHIGFSYQISSGNEADVEAADYVRYLLDDENTDVIALLVEGFKDGRKFAAVAELAAERRKPLVVLKLGRTALGGQIAASHTAILAGSDRVQEALFAQKGVIQVDDFDDLYEVAALLARAPLPEGSGVGVLSPSGGAAILAADLCHDLGLSVARLDPATEQELAATLPDYAAIQNPLDLTAVGTSDPTIYPRCLELMLADPNIHLLVLVLTVNANYDPLMHHIVQVVRSAAKPIVCIGAGDGLSGRGFAILEEGQVPLFRSFTKGFAAVRHLIRYARFQRDRESGLTRPAGAAAGAAAGRARSLVAGRGGGQTEPFSKQLLQAYGIPTTREELVGSREAALAAAGRIGYPVALKGISAEVLHKTEAGLVLLNLRSADEVAAGYRQLAARLSGRAGGEGEGILVQEMVAGGTEVILGVKQDAQFGPVVLFGIGGILVEALDDVVMRPAPLSRRDAQAMIWGIKGASILRGVRGRPPVDDEALLELLLRLSQLAVDLEDRLQELDLNPVLLFERGAGLKVVDALAVLKEASC